mmetsp:Transcript_12704/g.17657  ORF Transcript_12704/g.17657 Transcript_12704/m.17657 type:complete len:171 (-) Transcript_12704:126-638(-)
MGIICYKRTDSFDEMPPSIPSSPSEGLDSKVRRIMNIARKGRNWNDVLQLVARQQKTGISHYVDQYGKSLLHYAAEQGEVKALKRILTYGADVNGLDLSKHSPLGFAAASGSLKCVEILLLHKADVNAIDIHGHGPLYAAACRGHLAIVKSVVDHNARICCTDLDHKYTP